ncbi:MAG: hypothetical protein HYZ58_01510 [Acidobacteria bacterium]|nr:hypothetical protein [Acidobacteriota bacterium]
MSPSAEYSSPAKVECVSIRLAIGLFGVTATDPATFATVSVLLVSIAALASYLPARRGLIR